jgi:hypothetical protein
VVIWNETLPKLPRFGKHDIPKVVVLVRLLPQNPPVLVRLEASPIDAVQFFTKRLCRLQAPLLLMAYIVGMRAEIAEYDSRWPRLFQERGSDCAGYWRCRPHRPYRLDLDPAPGRKADYRYSDLRGCI